MCEKSQDTLAHIFAVSVCGIEILISLTAIDDLLFYFKECSLIKRPFFTSVFEQVQLQLFKTMSVSFVFIT